MESDDKLRIAIINPDKCKPKKCKQECKKTCPINKTGKICIEVMPTSTICFISETLCIGCGICVKVLVRILNFPRNARLRPFKSSTCLKILKKKQHIDMGQTRSSSIDSRNLAQTKFSVLSEQTELESQPLSRFSQTNLSPILETTHTPQNGKKFSNTSEDANCRTFSPSLWKTTSRQS